MTESHRASSDPVPMSQAVRDVFRVMTGVTLPEPCPRCGWQYPDDVLIAAVKREVVLDPEPTHLCQPRLIP